MAAVACRTGSEVVIPLTHYPKTAENLVFAWVQPAPRDVDPEDGLPDFLGRYFSEVNRFEKALEPNQVVVGYHDAQPFTRFYGSISCDQPLEVTISFSNDEVAADGRTISDDNIGSLNYDAEALKQLYDSKKQGPTGKYFCTIFGHWIRVEIKNVGEKPTEKLRVYVRGSVF
jgi:hypothetical protein